jgi:hypothetical protein
MLRPILFIGLGGAGGKTLRAIKQKLQQDLITKGNSAGIPTAWQFLHIDTPTVQDGAAFPAPMLLASEYYSVTRQGMTFQDIVNRVENLGPLAETQKMLAGWSTEFVPVQINCGAAQIRAVGRLALVADLRNTYDVIQKAISKMLSPVALPEIQGLASTLGIKMEETTPQVFIISSLGGGSGSGMFTDIAELVKRATNDSWGSQSVSLLYTPHVFRVLAHMGGAIPMNSLGAMNELIAGEGTGISFSTDLLYKKCGIPLSRDDSETSFGSRSNILVGSELGEMDDIIFDLGTTFAEAIVQDETSQFLLNVISTHNAQSKINSDDAGLATGLLSFDDDFLPAPEKLFPLWTNPFLTDSMRNKMEQSKLNVQTWDHFWEGRRARPLIESIPLDAETRRSMIAGWFIAPLFGMRKLENGRSGRSVKIWNPTLGVPGWSSFPDPLLPTHPADKSKQLWMLPQLLLSTGLALVEFGLTGDPTRIEGYRQLNHLGSEVNTAAGRVHWDSDRGARVSWKQFEEPKYLSDWIQSEVRPANELELSKSLAEVHGTPVDRAQALYASMERIRENYAQLWKEFEDKPWHEMPETWELREEIDLALKDIGDYAKKFYN